MKVICFETRPLTTSFSVEAQTDTEHGPQTSTQMGSRIRSVPEARQRSKGRMREEAARHPAHVLRNVLVHADSM